MMAVVARGIVVVLTIAVVWGCGGKTDRDTAGSGTGNPTGNGGSGGSRVDASAGSFGGDATSAGGDATGGIDDTGGNVATGGNSPDATGGEDSGGAGGQCPEGLTLCGDECVDLSSDSDNCGACGSTCHIEGCIGHDCPDGCISPREGWCSMGSCVSDCAAGLCECGQSCVDLCTSNEHCGECNNACPPGFDCYEGVCECESRLTLCGDQCIDLLYDLYHCGACDNACPVGLACTGGECVCPAGYDYCNGECVDLRVDWRYCGDCNIRCSGGRDCVNGVCECPGTYTFCDSVCVDTITDSAHCGACNNACSSDECVGGVCSARHGPEGPSCAGGLDCNGESCCQNILVPGGTFAMGRGTETCTGCTDGCPPSGMSCEPSEQPEHAATVSSFALDKYEVTVARFREFVNAYSGPPAAGAGAHPLIAGSAWDGTWDAFMPATVLELTTNLKCDASFQTWTDTAGGNETYPINCVNWFEAFAFCIWDGGRLPTEAEREYAAAGGDENRVFPWGSDGTEPLPANYSGNHNTPFLAVGSEPDGNGRWGHSDLAGSMWEWVLDWYASDWYTTTRTGCSDCANLTASYGRVVRGGGQTGYAGYLRAAYRDSYTPAGHSYGLGVRCSRSAP